MEQEILLYAAGRSDAAQYAAHFLKEAGLDVTTLGPEAATYVLLDVPSRDAPPEELAAGAVVLGGGPTGGTAGHAYIDLLRDPIYQAKNARITAHCALEVAAAHLPRTFYRLPVLILGWGRIGKCLGGLLRALGAQVTVAARKTEDRAMLEALGYAAVDPASLEPGGYRVVFNTAPARLVEEAYADCLMVELASGTFLPGPEVVSARGLPGRYAPEESGTLIAETVLRFLEEGRI